jgi:hypothetical protein
MWPEDWSPEIQVQSQSVHVRFMEDQLLRGALVFPCDNYSTDIPWSITDAM